MRSDPRSRRPTGWRWQALRLASVVLAWGALAADAPPLPGTQPLTIEGDVASHMIDGIDRFLDAQHKKALQRRDALWREGYAKPERRGAFVAEQRRWLAQAIGLRDERPAKIEMELVATTERPALVGKSPAFEAYAVRWRAFGDVHGEGLLLKPTLGEGQVPVADVVAIPDADQTPEQVSGLADGVPVAQQFARRLAEQGCRVVVPVLMDRRIAPRPAPGRTTGPELTNREYVFRQAYELGRHPLGFEVEKVRAAVAWCKATGGKERDVGAFGYGEGGLIALLAGAVDPTIDQVGVSGYFGNHDRLWTEPIDRTIFGLTGRFGNGELMLLGGRYGQWPVLESAPGPRFRYAGRGGAPGELTEPAEPEDEVARAMQFVTEHADRRKGLTEVWQYPVGDPRVYQSFLQQLTSVIMLDVPPAPDPKPLVESFNVAGRLARQLAELERHCQGLIVSSQAVRDEFMKRADVSSPAKYEASLKPYREKLYNDVLGRFDEPLLPPSARTRRVYDTPKFTGYEVLLDVFPDVIAYGILLLPKDLKDGERRPVVVCQHGLEGRPRETVEGDNRYYHDFAAKLAERGFITFSPQNPYIHGERFRALSRKASPLGKTLWSWIVPQHQQILAFLKAQPNVDPARIAFYGLSYGGKTALRVPAVLTDYCLSICSGDFNEWVYKISSNRAPWSYLFTHEYEIYEWDLASTFNHAEMAALIAPRPFMVERGHADGVSSDEWVAYEFAKVRRLYQGRLKLKDRCAIEFFDGPHEIRGVGTFEFLHKHLNREKR